MQKGLTLIELMIAMTISLILVSGMALLIAQTSSNRAEIDKSSRQVENGRYAMTVLQDAIEHAGFYGYYSGDLPALTALPDPCSLSAADIDESLAMPIHGYDSPATVPAPLSACLPAANHISGTDILVVRRLEATDSLPNIASLVTGQIYVQTTPFGKKTSIGPDPLPATPSVYTLTNKDGATPAPIRRFIEQVYFLSPCNVYAPSTTTCSQAADNGNPIPTLKRLETAAVGGVPTLITVPLVEGIQNMQFDYRVDAGNPAAAPYVTNVAAVADWPNVTAVQVNILARNTEPSGGYDGSSKTFSLGLAGSLGPFADAFKRHVYSQGVRAINLSGRRE